MRIAAVVLAAGRSARLGSPKQLERVNGETLLRRTARIAAAVGCRPVRVVLGYDASRMAQELTGLRVEALHAEDWSAGMGNTIARGVQALLAAGSPDGILLLVCDQWALDEEVLRRLVSAFSDDPSRIWASRYGGVRGVPALFPPESYSKLIALRGDRGAREWLRDPARSVGELPWPEGARDLDRPQDRPNKP